MFYSDAREASEDPNVTFTGTLLANHPNAYVLFDSGVANSFELTENFLVTCKEWMCNYV